MKIVITGAAGFIGSHLAERLLVLGHEVVGIDCFSDYYNRDLKELNAADVTAAGARIHRLNLATDPLDDVLAGADIIYHAAAQPGISDQTSFETYVTNNLTATHRLLNSALALPDLKGFINVATSSVYGKYATSPEDSDPRPTSFYGVTKLAAEQLALSYQREKGFPACSLRLFSVYGPRERPDKLYPKLIDCILSGKACPLYEGSRAHSRSFTFIDDIVAGFVSVLDHLDVCIGEIFNIGSDIEITTGRGIEIVEGIMGKPAEFEIKPKRKGDQLRTHANIDKARSVLGYEPKTAPEAGLRKEVEWFQSKIHGKVTL